MSTPADYIALVNRHLSQNRELRDATLILLLAICERLPDSARATIDLGNARGAAIAAKYQAALQRKPE